MEKLVVFVLCVMGCSLAKGRIVSKCELRDDLVKSIGNMTVNTNQQVLSGDNLLAKFVCHVKLASGFNTSVVKVHGGHLTPIWPYIQKRWETKELALPSQSQPFNHPPMKVSKPTMPATRHVRRRRSSQDLIGTFYGIFQLSNRLVCSDGTTPSPTICGMACRNLVDDDIRDDISCLLKAFTSLSDSGLKADDQLELSRMISVILQQRCEDVQPSVFFAECSTS